MKLNSFKTKLMGAVATVALLVTAFAFTGTTANAQGRHFHHHVVIVNRPFFGPYWGYNWYGPAYGYYPYVNPIAYQKETGYQDGFSRGKSDAKKGLAENPASHKHFNNSSSLAYRNAFQQGYDDGHRGEASKRG
ncbi:MAG TPA: hypothetical protein VFC63_10305 [Blastocatellia bacterium]|nr:hypothetical protein [Blastocatellia bacterium]